jgi:LDH2 family malate/lactate/ureidoglycolate dehydrogenase
MSETKKPIPVADLQNLCQTLFHRCGMSEADAALAADVLVTTDTFGVFSHGTKNLAFYAKRLRAGGLRADAAPTIEKQGPSWAVVNGQSAMAMITSTFAMNTAVEKAKKTGIAYVSVKNSCHFGAAGYYVNLAAKAGMIGLAMANDTPSMVAPGSRKPVLGTNPFSFAVPGGEEDSIFLDIASSAVAGGKVRIFQALDKKVPDTWLVDTEGVPTTDPFAYPYQGSLQPFAGHKGYGIALMIESLAGLVSGAHIRGEILGWLDSDPTQPTGHGAAMIAIDIGQMTPIDAFKKRIDEMIRDIRQTPPAKGVERVYLPGEMEWRKRREALANGIPLPDEARTNLRGFAEELGIKVDWF